MHRMDSTTVVRSTMPRIGAPLTFGALTAAWIPAFFEATPIWDRVRIGIVIGLCATAVVRGVRSGYLEVCPTRVKVRTLFRTKTMPVSTIRSVEARLTLENNWRMIPVVVLLDGRTYRLSEFFVWKRSYDRNPQNNLVTHAVQAIEGCLN